MLICSAFLNMSPFSLAAGLNVPQMDLWPALIGFCDVWDRFSVVLWTERCRLHNVSSETRFSPEHVVLSCLNRTGSPRCLCVWLLNDWRWRQTKRWFTGWSCRRLEIDQRRRVWIIDPLVLWWPSPPSVLLTWRLWGRNCGFVQGNSWPHEWFTRNRWRRSGNMRLWCLFFPPQSIMSESLWANAYWCSECPRQRNTRGVTASSKLVNYWQAATERLLFYNQVAARRVSIRSS